MAKFLPLVELYISTKMIIEVSLSFLAFFGNKFVFYAREDVNGLVFKIGQRIDKTRRLKLGSSCFGLLCGIHFHFKRSMVGEWAAYHQTGSFDCI